MFLTFRRHVEQLLAEALEKCDYPSGDFALTVKPGYADLTSRIAFKLAPVLRLKPQEIAQNVTEYLGADELIARAETAGPYINFFVSNDYLRHTLSTVLQADRDYGGIGANGVVILEHTSANPNGPLHIGHIRNSVIGDTLKRCLQKAGYHVETQYYVNDMGRQIALVVLLFFKFCIA